MKLGLVVVAAALLVAAAVAGNTNSTNDNCSVCGSASYVDIATWCSKWSGWSQACCKCIVQHESGGNAHACNKNVGGSIDAGLWQINDMNWASCSSGKAPCDPTMNLACAKLVFGWGKNTWKYWSTCGTCGCCSKA